jgi:hypothetical protein
MVKKLLIIGVISALLFAAAGYYYIFVYSVKYHRDVNKEAAISITSTDLTKAFLDNELSANQRYLNKAIEVKGAVLNIAYDQSGQKTVLIGAETELSNVFITLKDTSLSFKIGDTILVKAICNGFLSDIVLVDGVVKH